MLLPEPDLFDFEPSCQQTIAGDKGMITIGALGIPPLYHEDPYGAISAAQLIIEEIEIQSSIGITTGLAYCGSCGSDVRHEYTIPDRDRQRERERERERERDRETERQRKEHWKEEIWNQQRNGPDKKDKELRRERAGSMWRGPKIQHRKRCRGQDWLSLKCQPQ
eukprot:TRINITY_DN732_c0_g1_i4.p1 TRINITY_DN732_c0_g1~~TRINITY_DN732_c0_g1_i4.p1  ORF type:complete len:165 (+),score=50.54 TRINITY_DN732_c0_g1_i4:108-602(+)